jgi:hypothetical protein
MPVNYFTKRETKQWLIYDVGPVKAMAEIQMGFSVKNAMEQDVTRKKQKKQKQFSNQKNQFPLLFRGDTWHVSTLTSLLLKRLK